MAAPRGGSGLVRVLIADYSALFRSGMRRAIESEDGLEVAGEAADADAMSRVAARESFDVLVVGAISPRTAVSQAVAIACEARAGGVEASRSRPGFVAVVDVTDGDRDVLTALFDAVRAGASGLVDRSVGAEELVRAVRAVSTGCHFASSQVVRVLMRELVRLKEIASGFEEAVAHAAVSAGGLASAGELALHGLTARESEVLSLVSCGKSNREIARTLSISEKTVKNHVSSILHKLGAGRRTQAAVWAIGRGLAVVLEHKA